MIIPEESIKESINNPPAAMLLDYQQINMETARSIQRSKVYQYPHSVSWTAHLLTQYLEKIIYHRYIMERSPATREVWANAIQAIGECFPKEPRDDDPTLEQLIEIYADLGEQIGNMGFLGDWDNITKEIIYTLFRYNQDLEPREIFQETEDIIIYNMETQELTTTDTDNIGRYGPAWELLMIDLPWGELLPNLDDPAECQDWVIKYERDNPDHAAARPVKIFNPKPEPTQAPNHSRYNLPHTPEPEPTTPQAPRHPGPQATLGEKYQYLTQTPRPGDE